MSPGDLLPPLLRRPASRLKAALRRRLRPGRTRDLHLAGIGSGELAAVGRDLAALAVEPGGLRAGDRVLDVGCGLARLATPLAGYLDARGRYTGFDVVEDVVWWCRRSFRHDPRFEFFHADVRSGLYNPRGRIAPESFRFPLPDGSHDFALAVSLFTHLLAPAAASYLAEVARVLRPGGRLFATFFLLDEQAEEGIAAGRAAHRFRHPAGPARMEDAGTAEAAVAFPAAWVLESLQAAGLTLVGPVHRGTWSGPGDGRLIFQDLVIAERTARGG